MRLPSQISGNSSSRLHASGRESLFLRDNGNLRAVWSDDEGNCVGIQFFGDSARYVIFKRHADGEIWRDAKCDSLNNLERVTENLEFLLHA